MRRRTVSATIKNQCVLPQMRDESRKVSFNRHINSCSGSSPVLIKSMRALPQINRIARLNLRLH